MIGQGVFSRSPSSYSPFAYSPFAYSASAAGTSRKLFNRYLSLTFWHRLKRSNLAR